MDNTITSFSSVDKIHSISQKRQETSNLTTSYTQSPPNLPCGDLLGSRDDYNNICIPLYFASLKGDWETAKTILEKQPELVRSSITENCDTILHVAASLKSTSALMDIFVLNIMRLMEKKDLELQNINHNTALCLAVASGNLFTVRTIVERNPDLLEIHGSQRMLPLQVASLSRQGSVVRYLYGRSKKMSGIYWADQNRSWVLQQCVEADIFDVALEIVKDRPELIINGTVLGTLARKKDAFQEKKHKSDAKRLLRMILTDIVKLPKAAIEDIIRGPPDVIIDEYEKPTASENTLNLLQGSSDAIMQVEKETLIVKSPKVAPKYSSQLLFVATEMGNTRFVTEVIRRYPDLVWKTNDNNQTIFHVAVSHRHVGIYNLLQEFGSMKDMITPLKDNNGNNMLHLAGKSAEKMSHHKVSVPQMQKELSWFKEVESIIPFSCQKEKNKDGLLPRELFTKEHKDLMSAGEKWMKDTASQSMVVAALIATIVFAATYTLPGGYNQNNGIPMFLHRKVFTAFVIIDAIAFLLSSISIIVFLSILTSRFPEHDFLELLPYRMVIGQMLLFYSITFMMIAFSINFFILYQNSLIWVPILITLFASFTIFFFNKYQTEIITNGFGIRFKPKKLKLSYRNPKF